MRILLEGVDASGKSTLAETLCKSMNLEYIHNTFIGNDEIYVTKASNFQSFLINGLDDIVVDRNIISDYIYHPILAKENPRVELVDIENAVSSFDKTIICLPRDVKRYLKHFEDIKNQRGELISNIEDMELIYYEYEKLYFHLKTIKMNISRYDFFDMLKKK